MNCVKRERCVCRWSGAGEEGRAAGTAIWCFRSRLVRGFGPVRCGAVGGVGCEEVDEDSKGRARLWKVE